MNIASIKGFPMVSRLAVCIAASTVLNPACADIFQDSKASLELRNYYFNRDFRQSGVAQSKAEEWAQGLILRC